MSEALQHLQAAEDALARLRVAITRPTPPEPKPAPVKGLTKPAAFFDYVRTRAPLGPSLSEDEVRGCERILGACAAVNFPASWAAYTLATAYHETAGTLRPIAEYGKGHGKAYGQPGKHGQPAYGRGDVQLTWDYNYEAMDRALGLNGALVKNYDLALDPDVSKRIIVYGMEHGTFTGKSLGDYLPETATVEQFSQCRRTVNGMDKAALIASYAVIFQEGLKLGGWSHA